MAHVVQPHAPQPSLLPNGCEVPVEVARVEWRADLGSEDEAIFISPEPWCAYLLLMLLIVVGEQGTAGNLRERDGGVGCLCLGVIEEQSTVDALETLRTHHSSQIDPFGICYSYLVYVGIQRCEDRGVALACRGNTAPSH